jgi:hypothetical protein
MNDYGDYNYLRYAGWSQQSGLPNYYCPETIRLISRKVTQLTRGVDPKNRPIIVPDERIMEVMDGVATNYQRPVGDIFTRYNVPNDEQANVIQGFIDQTIEIIVSNVKTTLLSEEYNRTLTKWVTVYGDFNKAGLRSHDIIKTREKRPTQMMFNMMY